MVEVNKHLKTWKSFCIGVRCGEKSAEDIVTQQRVCHHVPICCASQRFIFINCTMKFLLWRVMPLFASDCVVCTQQVCVHNKLPLRDMERSPVREI